MGHDDSLEIMKRIRRRVVDESKRLQLESERLDNESNQLALEAKNLEQISIRLKARVSLMQARALALQRLADELSNTASMAESVGYLVGEGEDAEESG